MTTSEKGLDQTPKLALQVAVIFLAGLLSMAVFLSSSLVSLSYDLPPGRYSEIMVISAEFWHGLMARSGADLPLQMISDTVETAHEVALSDEY